MAASEANAASAVRARWTAKRQKVVVRAMWRVAAEAKWRAVAKVRLMAATAIVVAMAGKGARIWREIRS